MDKYAFTPCPFPNHEGGLMFWKGFQPCREVLIKKIHGVVFVSAIVLLLASIAVPNLNANDLYPNCIIMAIDANSGLVTSQETSSGKTFYFQVTDRAQLEHLRIHQGIWINNGQVSFDGAKPCACKIVSSPADVPGKSPAMCPNLRSQRFPRLPAATRRKCATDISIQQRRAAVSWRANWPSCRQSSKISTNAKGPWIQPRN